MSPRRGPWEIGQRVGAAIRAQQRRTLRQTPPLQTRRTPHDTGAQLRTLRQTPPLQTRRIAHPTCVTDDIGRAAAAIAPLCADAAAAVGLLITPAPLATSNAIAITVILLPLAFMLALLCDEPGP